MDIKEHEIARAETILFNQLPPLGRTFVINSKKINNTIEKFETLLLSIMNDNGTVSGKMLNEILYKKYPKVAEWINVPQKDFYLADEIQILTQVLFHGGI